MLHRLAPCESHSELLRSAFEPVVGVVVVEEPQVFVRGVAQTVFKRHVVEERLVLVWHVGTARHLSAHDNLEPVVPESLGKLERIIGVHTSRSIGGVVDAEAQIEGAKGISRYVVYLSLQERAEGTVH